MTNEGRQLSGSVAGHYRDWGRSSVEGNDYVITCFRQPRDRRVNREHDTHFPTVLTMIP